MRIATWNVNSLTARLPRVEEWIGYAHPDVLCLQETKQADAAFPHDVFADSGLRDGPPRSRAVERSGHRQSCRAVGRDPGLGAEDDAEGPQADLGRLWRGAGAFGLRAQRT